MKSSLIALIQRVIVGIVSWILTELMKQKNEGKANPPYTEAESSFFLEILHKNQRKVSNWSQEHRSCLY